MFEVQSAGVDMLSVNEWHGYNILFSSPLFSAIVL